MTLHKQRLDALISELERECDARGYPRGELFSLETAPSWALSIMNSHIIRLSPSDRVLMVRALKDIYGSGRGDIVLTA